LGLRARDRRGCGKDQRRGRAGSTATAGRMTPQAMPDRHGFDHGDPLRVLIADDNEADRELIKECLDEAGLPAIVHEAATGPSVIALYQSVRADCVLLDIFLPGTSGIDVLEQLTLDIHAPVIMLTGFGSENLAVAAMKVGAKDYMPKANVNPQSISRSIRNVVDRVAMLRKIDAQHEELESFARVLAHDLTAPVTALQGSAALLTHKVSNAPRNLEKIGRLSAAIARNARRMGAFITTLTEYTSVDGVVEFGTVSMQRVLDDVLAILEVTIRERGATVTHDALPELTGNSVLLTQLLQNLVCNALKYCGTMPLIHVGAAPAEDGGWLFSVRDNGIGIAEENLQHVFRPFKRLHRNDSYGGMGLGLATCKRIVEQRLHGRMWCESTLGRGTTFFFAIPPAQK
jgi:signal transduction histidine kinase